MEGLDKTGKIHLNLAIAKFRIYIEFIVPNYKEVFVNYILSYCCCKLIA